MTVMDQTGEAVVTTTVATTTTLATTTGFQQSRGPSKGYSYPVCTTCGRRHPGECRRAAGTCFKCGQTGHLQKDCKKNTAASTSGQADKKPGASGRVFAITKDHTTKTSENSKHTGIWYFSIEGLKGFELENLSRSQKCTKRAVRQAYHNLCNACAKEHHVCAKCSCRVERIVGRDITEVEAEQKMLQEAISNAREREKRSLLRAMNKGKSETKDKEQDPTDNPDKAGDLFKAESLEAYAGGATRDDEDEDDSEDEIQVIN
nr:hypothetical protein [Tanacetum cinerariifolium]